MKRIIIALAAGIIAVIICLIYFFFFRKEPVSDKHILVTAGGKSFLAVLYDTEAAEELYSRLPLELEMNELNGNEKYYNFDKSFAVSSKLAGHISKGDLKLYGDDCLVLFYDSFSSTYSYTDIGYIEDTDGLEEALGQGSVTVSFTAGTANRTVTTAESTAETEQTTTAIQQTTTVTSTQTTTASQTTSAEAASQKEETVTAGSTAEEEKQMKLEIAGTPVTVEWEDNASVEALKELCKNGSLNIQMSMYGGFEQVGPIGASLPREDVQTTTGPGDIVLYSGDQIVVFYGSNSWSYTRLGHITDSSGRSLEELLGSGDVSLTVSPE